MFTNTEEITSSAVRRTVIQRTKHKVIAVNKLTPETFVIRIERNGFDFQSGQYVVLRIPELNEGREYSIFSGIKDDYLEFLVREIPAGKFSRYLRYCRVGEELEMEGPKGFFVLNEQLKDEKHPLLFIASGTGISPFHSYVRSFEGLNYQVLHGIQYVQEAYGMASFNREQILLCTTRDKQGDYQGRVTAFLKEKPVDKQTVCYLCGNSQMIEEVTVILEAAGLPPENIRTEVFF